MNNLQNLKNKTAVVAIVAHMQSSGEMQRVLMNYGQIGVIPEGTPNLRSSTELIEKIKGDNGALVINSLMAPQDEIADAVKVANEEGIKVYFNAVGAADNADLAKFIAQQITENEIYVFRAYHSDAEAVINAMGESEAEGTSELDAKTCASIIGEKTGAMVLIDGADFELYYDGFAESITGRLHPIHHNLPFLPCVYAILAGAISTVNNCPYNATKYAVGFIIAASEMVDSNITDEAEYVNAFIDNILKVTDENIDIRRD